jgi:hypothetical protein
LSQHRQVVIVTEKTLPHFGRNYDLAGLLEILLDNDHSLEHVNLAEEDQVNEQWA